MAKSTVDSTAGLEAALNAGETVTLYHPNGKTMTVDRADLDFWLNEGYRQTRADPTATADELKALFPEVLDAVLRYVSGVTSDGVIDTSDEAAQATAHQAMRRLEQLWGQLVRDIESLYTVAQGQSVPMRMPDGSAVNVDPGQVDHYLTQGWTHA
jgi:hypothetical protein